MKKVFSLIFVIAFALLLTGCGKEKVVCSIKQTTSGIEMTMEGTYYIENGKVTGLDTIVDIDLPEKYLNSKDQMVKTLESTLTRTFAGTKPVITSKDNNIHMVFNMDKKDINSYLQKSGVSDKASAKEIKEELESQGYTCK